MRCFSSFEYELVYYTAVLWVVTQRSFTQTPFVGRSVAWRLKDTTKPVNPDTETALFWNRSPGRFKAPVHTNQGKKICGFNYQLIMSGFVWTWPRNFALPAEFQECLIVPIVCQQLDLRVRLVWDIIFFSSVRTWFQKMSDIWHISVAVGIETSP